MKLGVKFEQSKQRFKTNFGTVHNISDGGYERGYAEGYEIGNEEGYTEGHTDGVEKGFADGYKEGLENAPIPDGYIIPSGELEITENKTYDVTEYASVNVKVGEDTPSDGKTRLYIEIAAEGRMDLPLYFYQSVANGVIIDWGDGSSTETINTKGNVNKRHTYSKIGKYVITLDAVNGCTFELGAGSFSNSIFGSASSSSSTDRAYTNMLKKVEIGNNVTRITDYAFRGCYSLSSIIIPDGVYIRIHAFMDCYSLSTVKLPKSMTETPQGAFYNCYSLSSVIIPDGVRKITAQTFYYCYSLSSIVIPSSVTHIDNSAFESCRSMKFYDFSKHTAVPTLANISAFSSIPSDCEIRVPASLYDEWIAATNWSTYASKIVAV